MKLYFAGPLFTTAERAWNAEVTAGLRAAGHDVYLPQDNTPSLESKDVFTNDKAGLDAAEGIVAIMDGPDPDSGTCWEVGYAYGNHMPIVLVRTDLRSTEGEEDGYNPMMTQSATVRVKLRAASTEEVIAAIVDALARVEAGIRA